MSDVELSGNERTYEADWADRDWDDRPSPQSLHAIAMFRVKIARRVERHRWERQQEIKAIRLRYRRAPLLAFVRKPCQRGSRRQRSTVRRRPAARSPDPDSPSEGKKILRSFWTCSEQDWAKYLPLLRNKRCEDNRCPSIAFGGAQAVSEGAT